eukprot:1071132-Pyramimonas_sp.AAC.1
MAVFFAKGDVSDDSQSVRPPEKTRPISLSNADNKIISSALNSLLSLACRRVAPGQRRGFVRGRQCSETLWISRLANAAKCADEWAYFLRR